MKNQIALLCSLIAIVYAVFFSKNYNAREKIRVNKIRETHYKRKEIFNF